MRGKKYSTKYWHPRHQIIVIVQPTVLEQIRHLYVVIPLIRKWFATFNWACHSVSLCILYLKCKKSPLDPLFNKYYEYIIAGFFCCSTSIFLRFTVFCPHWAYTLVCFLESSCVLATQTTILFPRQRNNFYFYDQAQQSTIPDDSLVTVNCTVAYMAQCMSWNKCKASCTSMGASSYR